MLLICALSSSAPSTVDIPFPKEEDKIWACIRKSRMVLLAEISY